jgi:hypothetical protein
MSKKLAWISVEFQIVLYLRGGNECRRNFESNLLKMLILKGLGAYTLALLGLFLQFGFLLCP